MNRADVLLAVGFLKQSFLAGGLVWVTGLQSRPCGQVAAALILLVCGADAVSVPCMSWNRWGL